MQAQVHCRTHFVEHFRPEIYQPFAHFVPPKGFIYSWTSVEQLSQNVVFITRVFPESKTLRLLRVKGSVLLGDVEIFKLKNLQEDVDSLEELLDKTGVARLQSLIGENYPNFFLVYLEDSMSRDLACLLQFLFDDYKEANKIDKKASCKV